MKLDELKAACREVDPLSGEPRGYIYLTMPRKSLPKGATTRLLGRSGPRGRICTVNEVEGGGFNCVAVFKAPEVLAYVEANE